jgi:hypothetical protein
MELILSKEYLVHLPNNRPALIAEQIYKSIVSEVFNAALSNKTSYKYDLVNCYFNKNMLLQHLGKQHNEKNMCFSERDMPLINMPLIISNEDLVSKLKPKFPGCKVSYFGNGPMPDYTDINILSAASRAMMHPDYIISHGILIDWS